MPTFNPFREHFSATYKIIFRTCRGRVQVSLGSERTTDGTGGTRTDASFEKHADDDMAKCNTQANDMATMANNWQTPGASNPGR